MPARDPAARGAAGAEEWVAAVAEAAVRTVREAAVSRATCRRTGEPPGEWAKSCVTYPSQRQFLPNVTGFCLGCAGGEAQRALAQPRLRRMARRADPLRARHVAVDFRLPVADPVRDRLGCADRHRGGGCQHR